MSKDKVQEIRTSEQKVEDLLKEAKKEVTDESTRKMVRTIKLKLMERKSATKVLANIDREIEMLKLELAQELDSI